MYILAGINHWMNKFSTYLYSTPNFLQRKHSTQRNYRLQARINFFMANSFLKEIQMINLEK